MSARRRAGVEPVSSADGHRLGAEQPLDRREVLLGERLGGRHQRRLVAVLDGAQHRVQRDHRLAAADLAHQQPLHRRAAARGPRAIASIAARWSPVSANGSAARQPARAQRAAARRARARPCALARRARRRRNTSCVSSSSSNASRARARSRGPARSRGKCIAASALARSGSRSADPRRRRQRLGHVAQRAPAPLHEREDLGRGDALGGRVVRDRAASPAPARRRPSSRRRRARRVVGDAEAAAPVGLAVQQQARPRRVALDQPRLVEERRAHAPGGVEHASPPPAGASPAGAPAAR